MTCWLCIRPYFLGCRFDTKTIWRYFSRALRHLVREHVGSIWRDTGWASWAFPEHGRADCWLTCWTSETPAWGGYREWVTGLTTHSYQCLNRKYSPLCQIRLTEARTLMAMSKNLTEKNTLTGLGRWAAPTSPHVEQVCGTVAIGSYSLNTGSQHKSSGKPIFYFFCFFLLFCKFCEKVKKVPKKHKKPSHYLAFCAFLCFFMLFCKKK